ncbi:phosphoethanolamine transferase [Avibacterium sp. 21-594]|uniref:phosphoethanolamine transferase n=1 Tax=Avibacterium sp. 21-594 TaxID=2911535 RepID=UPI00224603A0|nr:sulfatase-like hydrolase/transferase [Avibacterium sp. 21-594]MCW9715056.1 sulfatase-like hydrolase/transferase [Avibacterium sp. 21-594]
MKKALSLIVLYSVLLLGSELLYRIVFAVPALPMGKLAENYAFILVFVALLYFVKSRIVQCLLLAFFAMSFIGNNIHYAAYQGWITPMNLYLLFKEWHEVVGASSSLIEKTLFPALWGLLEVILISSILCFQRKRSWIADGAFFLLIIFGLARVALDESRSIISPKLSYSRIKTNYLSLSSFVGHTLPYKFLHLSVVTDYQMAEPQVASKPKVRNIIFLLGESESAKHVSYFGYNFADRQTTPFLTQFAQSDAQPLVKETYSAGLLTAITLPSLFNAIQYPNGLAQISKGTTNLFRLAKQQGYQTYFYTAQSQEDMDLLNLLGKTWIDELKYPTDLGFGFKQHMSDRELLPLLKKIDLQGGNHFIILHQRGSHMPYGKILTAEQKVFGDQTANDEYDNTIYATDQLMKEIIHYLAQQPTQDWLFVYTSDHGQFVTPERHIQATMDEDNYLVPTVLYSPDSVIQQQLQQDFSQCDRLFHQQISTLLLNLFGYKQEISSCKLGYVNNNDLTGDQGYLKISPPYTNFVMPTMMKDKN